MSTPTLENLKPKFLPFLIGSPQCPAKIKTEIDEIFREKLFAPLKDAHVFDAGNWILKGERAALLTAPDTHLYRVRKAEKVRNFIRDNHLEDHLEVPNKYIYWHREESKFYVVAERLNLSNEVPKPASTELEEILCKNKPQRSLTVVQAKSLAELSFLGLTDLSYNNLLFTQEGKVAIIDTEPVKRAYKKRVRASWFYFFFEEMDYNLIRQSIAGIAKLKLAIDNPTALDAVRSIEREHALWAIATLITKISAFVLAFFTVAPFVSTMPTTFQVGFLIFSLGKYATLTGYLLSLLQIWWFSCEGIEGVRDIVRLERKEII